MTTQQARQILIEYAPQFTHSVEEQAWHYCRENESDRVAFSITTFTGPDYDPCEIHKGLSFEECLVKAKLAIDQAKAQVPPILL